MWAETRGLRLTSPRFSFCETSQAVIRNRMTCITPLSILFQQAIFFVKDLLHSARISSRFPCSSGLSYAPLRYRMNFAAPLVSNLTQ